MAAEKNGKETSSAPKMKQADSLNAPQFISNFFTVPEPPARRSVLTEEEALRAGNWEALARIRMAVAAREASQGQDFNGDGEASKSLSGFFDGGVDKHGGRYSEDGRYYDAFGGFYDRYGYEHADGSYTSVNGTTYDASTNKVVLADGTERKMPENLDTAEERKAVVRADAAVVDHDNNNSSNTVPMTDDQKTAAGQQAGGALGKAAGQPTQEQQEVSNIMVETRIEEGKSLEEFFTGAEVEAARAKHRAQQAAAQEMHRSELGNQTERRGLYEAAMAGMRDEAQQTPYRKLTRDEVTKLGIQHSNIHPRSGLATEKEAKPGDGKEQKVETAAEHAGHGSEACTGWYSDGKGYWDEHGGYYDDKGGYWDAEGGYADKDGGYTDKFGGYLSKDGSYMDAKGNYVDKDGNLWLSGSDGPSYAAKEGVDYVAQLRAAARENKDWAEMHGKTPGLVPAVCSDGPPTESADPVQKQSNTPPRAPRM